jgi:serpin B
MWKEALLDFHSATGASLGGKCKTWSGSPDISVFCDSSLEMPKFKVDYGKDLTRTLGAMGMPIPGGAVPEICGGCFISSVVQKTHLEVDEKGTTAAAATGVVIQSGLPMPTVIDHPFALALIENASDAPLFLGVIGNL